eukprot:2184673-Pleurochrysis_carterae.AAC.5
MRLVVAHYQLRLASHHILACEAYPHCNLHMPGDTPTRIRDMTMLLTLANNEVYKVPVTCIASPSANPVRPVTVACSETGTRLGM